MKIINNKIYIKILFFGTALAGKTTSLKWIFENIIPEKMKINKNIKSIKTSFGQTLLLDFVQVQLNENILIRFFTSTGQNYYAATRKILMEGVDGIFFVIDSQKKELDNNKEFVKEFKNYLENIKELEDTEVIVLYNKQDLNDVYPLNFLMQELGLSDYPSYPISALNGKNLKIAFIDMISRLLKKIKLIKEHSLV